MTMTQHTKAYDVITDRIIDALDKGIVPWRKPWNLPPGTDHQNAFSKHAYRGINRFVLGMSAFDDNRWATFKQIKDNGGHIRRGEKGTPVVFWKFLEVERENQDGEATTNTIPMLRYYTVFNVSQADGLDLPTIETTGPTFDAVDAAEKIVANMTDRPHMDHNGGDRAYYIPSLDQIHLPPRKAFSGAQEYYSTAFHELGHSTGHESRLNRRGLETGVAAFGSPVYSREELVAEFTSAFLCHASGIENTIENSTAYVQSWLKALKNDSRIAVVAASQAQRAADYITNA